MVLKFLSVNAKGLNSPYKCRALREEAMDQHCDILCVQEKHFAAINPPRCSENKFPHIFQANFQKKKREVMVAITIKLLDSRLDEAGRYIILVTELNDVTYTLLIVHSPNSHQLRFLLDVCNSFRPEFVF